MNTTGYTGADNRANQGRYGSNAAVRRLILQTPDAFRVAYEEAPDRIQNAFLKILHCYWLTF
ncbi:hypothetical protein HF264_25955 [Rhizobium leguminosarum]|uniref:hypothetical protein n=1 Tax=Rhizobium leguminosarum TaxID=384 RepID=UPI001C90E404|nr:hypothetical protein [Rhizobium leguminosarum]MBY2943102.1 hypothetical protein [Rhizobium leguminosarum]